MNEMCGMTVNERLCVTGLLDSWDEAVRVKDRDAMLAIMRQVGVHPPENTVDAVLADPVKYSF